MPVENLAIKHGKQRSSVSMKNVRNTSGLNLANIIAIRRVEDGK
jgi:hypothetical protein